jgi:hypothetical protein
MSEVTGQSGVCLLVVVRYICFFVCVNLFAWSIDTCVLLLLLLVAAAVVLQSTVKEDAFFLQRLVLFW